MKCFSFNVLTVINNEKGVLYNFVYNICNYDKFLIISCFPPFQGTEQTEAVCCV